MDGVSKGKPQVEEVKIEKSHPLYKKDEVKSVKTGRKKSKSSKKKSKRQLEEKKAPQKEAASFLPPIIEQDEENMVVSGQVREAEQA